MTSYDSRAVELTAQEIIDAVRSVTTLSADSVRTLRKSFSGELTDAPPRFLYRLAVRLVKEEAIWYRFIGYELLSKRRDAMELIGEKELRQLGKGMKSWEDTDTFGTYIAGPVWRAGQMADDVIVQWAKSKDLWWRRAALVATVPLNQRSKGASGDTRRTIKICRLLVDDHEDMVVKAMSWALRELVWHDAKAVREFLGKHEDRLASRVKREVRNKLETGLKNPRR